MSERLFVRDQAQLDASKIEADNDPVHGPITVFKDVVIASEIVHEYEDGWAYKPADELEKAYWTWNDRWAIAEDHPETGIIMSTDLIHGKTTNLRFVKNLNDHKTGRPNRRGILADLVIFDRKVTPELLTDMKNGKKQHVSVGFFFTKDETPGNWNGVDYAYLQRAFMGDHTAFGLEVGRCPFPDCGIGADQLIKATGDPFAGYETFNACIKDIMKKNPEYTRKQAAGTCAVIEKRSKEKHKSDAETNINEETLKSIVAGRVTGSEVNERAYLRFIRDTEKVDDLKSKVNEVLSGLDDLVEEEAQGNAELETESERAMKFFNINKKTWTALSDDEKTDYISKLPPKKKRAGGEEMSEKDCTYEWVAVREKILALSGLDATVMSNVFGGMRFDGDNIVVTQNARAKLSEMGVELDDCEQDEDEKVGADLTLEQINSKLDELKKHRDDLREKTRKLEKKLYDDPPAEKKRKADLQEQINQLWDEMSDVHDDIYAFNNAKTAKITQSALQDEYDETETWIIENIGKDAVLTSKQKRALPDSAYAYIEKGCEKEDGKTEQKCRHFPINDKAHVAAALQALGGARTGKTPAFAKQAKPKICAAAKKFKIESEVCGTKGDELPSTDEVLKGTERVLGDLERLVG